MTARRLQRFPDFASSGAGKHFAILVICAFVAAAGVARWCMASGIGISPDSVFYLSAADSVIAGHGLRPIAYHYTPTVASGKPQAVFPPVYPLLLSLSDLFSTDRLAAAMWFHSLVFAANVCLVATMAYLATAGSAAAAIAALMLFITSPRLLEVHTMAWSDPPFMLFALSSMLFLMLHIARPRKWLLASVSLTTALALTTRYVGITMLPPMIVAILLLENQHLKRCILDGVVVIGAGLSPLVAWLVRNVLIADSTTSRSFALHPIGMSDLNDAVTALLMLSLPFSGNAYVKATSFCVVCGLMVVGLTLVLKHERPIGSAAAMNASVQVLAALFVTSYVLFLFAYNSLVDPAVELDSRVLAPAYVFALVLVIAAVYKLSIDRHSMAVWRGFLALAFALTAVNGARTVSFAIHRHDEGSSFTSADWVHSASIQYVKTLSEARTIYSNGVDAIHVLTGREALRIPAKVDPMNGKRITGFDGEMNAARGEVIRQRAVVVYFDRIAWRSYLPSKDELEDFYMLPVLVRLDDGVVYGIK